MNARGIPVVLLILMGIACLGQDPPRESQPDQKVNARGQVQRQGPIFEDAFESGDTTAWIAESDVLPHCNCYFSGDCRAGLFCYWGPGGPGVEDNCNWRLPKPNGVPGEGCFVDTGSPGPICDGFCTESRTGSLFGHEDPLLVIEGIQHWAEAILAPSRAGGGPVDPDLAAQAMGLPFKSPHAAMILGRHVADVLILAGGLVFYEHFCHYEFGAESPLYFVDLSDEPCVYQAGLHLIEGLIAEIDTPGLGREIIDRIPEHCPDWQTRFTTRCLPGPGSLECLKQRIGNLAVFLTTPYQ